MARYFGFNPPFLRGGRIMDFQEDERLVKNDLIQLILTTPGERVMRPTFGTNLRRTLFEGITPGVLIGLKDNILQAIAREEPRVVVNNLDIIDNSQENSIRIQFEGALTLDPNRNFEFELDVEFDQPGQ